LASPLLLVSWNYTYILSNVTANVKMVLLKFANLTRQIKFTPKQSPALATIGGGLFLTIGYGTSILLGGSGLFQISSQGVLGVPSKYGVATIQSFLICLTAASPETVT